MSFPPQPTRGLRLALALLVSLVLAASLAACGGPEREPPRADGPVTDGQLARELKGAVSERGAFDHLRALQRIADDNGGNRAAPGPGFTKSVDYVIGSLRRSGYTVDTPTYVGHEHAGPPATLRNVVAQTRTGDPERVVVIGAHVDSVEAGPGIVDDGSGVATLLEIADRLGASPPVRQAVRFVFFGSEETGLEGSTAYVDGLSAEERQKIMLYLNVDMVASSNGGYRVQGGAGHDESTSGPPGSAAVGRVLAEQLGTTGVTAETVEFVGDDEWPFVEAGIPSGGAENGDHGVKSEEQARAWGGQAGQVFDPCFHSACDRVDNVNRVVLDHYLHALAGTVAYFATVDEKPFE
ncbi:M20/M25/M40 family metallo-hydrolase [Saccharomonospora azurea]|uniref:M20/M25/M40 family metallo-hydrolase n=1 Tax=Saccharomonospora azurea TaxID=40988 RepID=UPI003D947A4C